MQIKIVNQTLKNIKEKKKNKSLNYKSYKYILKN